MNTIMKGLAECRYCGKTIRFLFYERGIITIEAESTAPDDTVYDPKRHVPHRARCANNKPLEVSTGEAPVLIKKPCNCGNKGAEDLFPNMLHHQSKIIIDEKS